MASAIDATKPVAGSPTTQSVRDNFATAASEITALQIAPNKTITLSGDATGSGTTAIPVTLANTAVTAGSYTAPNITVDAKGRLTAATSGAPATWTGGSIPYATSTTALGQNNANLFWDNTNVRLGVGTTTPQVRLAATGPSGAQVGNGQEGVAQFTTGTGAQTDNKLQFGIVDASYAWVQGHHPGTGSLNLALQPGGGNVGIGTTTPAARVTVSGAGQTTPLVNTASIASSLLVDDTGAATNSGGSIIFSANSQAWRFGSIQGMASSGSSNSQGHLSFSTRRVATDAALTESMRITDMGTCLNTSGSWSTLSDASVKQDVSPYTRGLDAIVALKPVQFRYAAGMLFTPADKPSRKLFGLIADEVKPHVPEIVGTMKATIGKKDGVELSTLEPGNLIYALINAVRELNDQGKEMRAKIAALESATVH